MRLPPIVWITAAFAAGIALAEHRLAPDVPLWSLIGGTGLAWALAWIARLDRLGSILAIVGFAALGLAHADAHTGREPSWPQAADGRAVVVQGVVHSPPERASGGGWRAVVRVRAAAFGEREVRRPGRFRRVAPHPQADAAMMPVEGLVRIVGRHAVPAAGVGDDVRVCGVFRLGRPPGNPGEWSERDALRRRGLVGVINTGRAGGITVLHSGGWSVRGTIATIRQRIVDAVLRALPAPHDGLLLSLLLGIDAHLPPDVYQRFTRAGLVHLMVVSGAQIAIVAGSLAAAARLSRLPYWASAVIVALGVTAFAALVGWAPSIGRAVIMATVALAGTLLGRPRDRGATLAAAALILLVASPGVVFDIGFQLSFAATWGLLFVAPVVQRHLAGVDPRLAAALGVTLGAQVAVAPLLAAHFQTVPLAGLLANLLALPVVAALVPIGFALMPLLVGVPFLAEPLLGLLRPGLDVLLWIGARFGDLSWAALVTPPVSPAAVALFYALLAGAVALLSDSWRPSRAWRACAGTAAALAFSIWYAAALRPPPVLVVTMLDVGQGDAILIRTPSGRSALIDGGGEIGAERSGWDIGRMRVVPALRRAGVRRLDVVVLSHPHEDHVGGLPAVAENFPVGLVLDPGVPHPAPSYLRFLRLIEARRIPYRQAKEGLEVDLGSGARFSILHPADPPPNLDGDPVHAQGVVARLTYGQTAVLLTGDAETPVERLLIDRGARLSSQVLKVGHHGSRTSTSPEFVARVRPRIALVSVGADNPFGHPHPATLDILTAAGAAIYRTDRDGAVRVTSDGTTIRVSAARRGVDARVR